MKEFLNKSRKRYFLNLGKYTFSPVIQLSTSIVLDYSEAVQKNISTQPLFITFPSKQNAALWVSTQYMINIFFHNYVYQSEDRIQELKLNAGDKIDIFSTTAIYRGVDSEGKLVISFSDDVEAYIDNRNTQFVNIARKKMVNKYSHFVKKKKAFLEERKALTQILGLDLNPNFGALESKVIMITGRGKAGHFRNLLNQTKIYGESLSETLLLDKNLIISPDFSYFEGIDDIQTSNNNLKFFITAFDSILNKIESNDLDVIDKIRSLKELSKSKLRSKQFVDSYFELINFLSEHDESLSISEKLSGLFTHYPGVEKPFLEDIRAVIINDVRLLFDYPKTIKIILEKKIPVITITDRVVDAFNDLNIYDKLFQSEDYKNSFRFNWDRFKLSSLNITRDVECIFIDHELNNLCHNSTIQSVRVIEYERNNFDPIFEAFETSGILHQLNDLERLQKAYYQILRPLLYIVKNSSKRTNNTEILEALEVFETIFAESSIGLEEDVKNKIKNGINNFKKYLHSGEVPKRIESSEDNRLYQNILVNGYLYTIPEPNNGTSIYHHNDVNENAKSIIFTGYPYRDYYFKFLAKSIFSAIVPEIYLHLNKCEATISKNFLVRKFKTGYFNELLPPNINGLNEFIINSDQQINELIGSCLEIESLNLQEEKGNLTEYEDFEKLLNDIRYSEHSASKSPSDTDARYILNCDVLHFRNGAYLFLPHKRRLLLIKESQTHEFKSEYSFIDNTSIGDIAVELNVSRRSVSDYIEDSGTLKKDLNTLYTWRKVLKEKFKKTEGFQELLLTLSEVNIKNNCGGNPEFYNVIRWLHDESLLSPNEDNLKMILSLKYAQDDVPKISRDIFRSKRVILKAKNKLDKTVKNKLSRIMTDSYMELKGEFTVQINGIDVKAQKAEIVGIEKRDDLLIDYHSTMKFIND